MNLNPFGQSGKKIIKETFDMTKHLICPAVDFENRHFVVKYWTDRSTEYGKLDNLTHTWYCVAVDAIHAEQIFWDKVRETNESPLQYAGAIESIRIL